METKAKNSSSAAKNVAIALFGVATLAAGYYAYDQYNKNTELNEQLVEMQTKLDYNALEAQYANEQFAEIESNLASIREKEGYVLNNLNTGEFQGDASPEERIRMEIDAIEHLIGENNNLIDGLKGQIGEKDSRLKKYKHSVANLEKRVAEYKSKTDELVAHAEQLKQDLASAKDENQDITKELAQKEFVVAMQTQQINYEEEQRRTAYYAVGTFKELKESDVVEKEGGFLGIASAKTIKDDFNQKRFNRIDMYDDTTIPVFGKDAELVSNHSTDSYDMVEDQNGEVKWLQIKDPDKFWESTKYLVILTKGGQYNETAFAK
ncbi:MAG: hypothetical protein GC178_10580 [Flavobacteriales bacterium]|nr:hypothetical protein [Flavobacteriales bacterium]